MERRYLGSFSVPFETIYTEGRVEGVFRLDTPAINFGYDHAASGITRREKQQSNMFEGNINNVVAFLFEHVMLTYFGGRFGVSTAGSLNFCYIVVCFVLNFFIFFSYPGTEEAEAEANRIAEEDRLGTTGSIWSTFMRLMECLSQTNSAMSLKHPDDNLYYRGSHIHQDTQVQSAFLLSGIFNFSSARPSVLIKKSNDSNDFLQTL